MRVFGLLILLLFTNNLFAQDKQEDGTMAFPVGSHFVLRLNQVDDVNYQYRMAMLQQTEFSNDSLIIEDELYNFQMPETIECLFNRDVDEDGSPITVLLIKNNSEEKLSYKGKTAENQLGPFAEALEATIAPGDIIKEVWSDTLLNALVIYDIHK